ncbi:hypothetical protein MesoLj131b_73410 (plasmid) [Mesorhizobium sp. 131-2-5]|nr:hypothetical protein MesoLj131b_73410 [Mesorhizobium sp. 131-2-5]
MVGRAPKRHNKSGRIEYVRSHAKRRVAKHYTDLLRPDSAGKWFDCRGPAKNSQVSRQKITKPCGIQTLHHSFTPPTLE